MIPFNEALGLVLAEAGPLPSEEAPPLVALGRACASTVLSPVDLPAWDRSLMDGFAVRSDETASASHSSPVRLKVIADLPAGRTHEGEVGTGECVRIMTGAPLPRGCDAVVKREDAADESGTVLIRVPAASGRHVRSKGGDLKAGAVLVQAGRLIGSDVVGVLAEAGVPVVKVLMRPVVAILSIGDELVEPGAIPGPGEVITGNNAALEARVLEAGAVPLRLGTAKDRVEDIVSAVGKAGEADVVLTVGGTGDGSHDLARAALDRLGFAPRFQGAAMKPGKSVFFGRLRRSLVFGLPGSPPAAMHCFDVLVLPALLKMMGRASGALPPIVSLVGKSGAGKTTFMEKLIPALVRRGYAVGAIKHHSHRGFDIDVEGKDSWRHKKAGARQVVVSCPDKLALVRDADHDAGLAELREAYCRGLDLILSEGYKREVFPKVEVFRKGVHESLLCEGAPGLIALVTDAGVDAGVPTFGLDDADGVADLIESAFLPRRK